MTWGAHDNYPFWIGNGNRAAEQLDNQINETVWTITTTQLYTVEICWRRLNGIACKHDASLCNALLSNWIDRDNDQQCDQPLSTEKYSFFVRFWFVSLLKDSHFSFLFAPHHDQSHQSSNREIGQTHKCLLPCGLWTLHMNEATVYIKCMQHQPVPSLRLIFCVTILPLELIVRSHIQLRTGKAMSSTRLGLSLLFACARRRRIGCFVFYFISFSVCLFGV